MSQNINGALSESQAKYDIELEKKRKDLADFINLEQAGSLHLEELLVIDSDLYEVQWCMIPRTYSPRLANLI